MRFLSVFAGIGGFDLGLERAGMRCVGQIEISGFCQRVLAKHWPNVPRHDDVRTVSMEWVESLGGVDLVAGGFPCQDLSHAGNLEGIEGDRSGLFWDLTRVVRMVRPRWIVLENVSNLASRSEWMGAVVAELAACGFSLEWDCVPACAVGAPHIRDRIFIVGRADPVGVVADAGRVGREGLEECDGEPSRRCDGERRCDAARCGDSVADADGSGCEQLRSGVTARSAKPSPECGCSVFGSNAFGVGSRVGVESLGLGRERGSGYWETESGVGRMADGFPGRVDRLRGLGNAVVPQVAEWIGRRVMMVNGDES